MCKQWLIVFMMLIVANIFGQSSKVSVEKFVTKEKLLQGILGEKYRITIYLKMHDEADEAAGIYSVRGWYYYDKHKKKIPLVGIYNGNLILYQLKTEAERDKVLNFDNHREGHMWTHFDKLADLMTYEEKFVYEVGGEKNRWMGNGKILSLDIYSTQLDLFEEMQLIRVKTSKGEQNITLSDLGLYCPDPTVVAYQEDASGYRILLSYDYASRPSNVQGMCGAGMEVGYLLLKYDKNFDFVESIDARTESCLMSVYAEEMKSNNRSEKIFKIEDAEGKTEVYRVNMELATITVE